MAWPQRTCGGLSGWLVILQLPYDLNRVIITENKNSGPNLSAGE